MPKVQLWLRASAADRRRLLVGDRPRLCVAVLGKYFDAMSTVIYRHSGTVDKYIGDGIMAFWRAPLPDDRHAERALRAAIDMQDQFGKLARRLERKGAPVMSMRIGIHTGNVIVGNVGSRARFAYTAIGDAVNLASRLEGANKAYGTSILLSEATVLHLKDQVSLRPVDSVMVKGRTDAVMIFTPCADETLAGRINKRRRMMAEKRSPASGDGLLNRGTP